MMFRVFQLAAVIATLGGCCPAPGDIAAEPAPPENWVYIYARLYESQFKDSAEDQYLADLEKALGNYKSTIVVEEITGTEGDVESIGIDFKIAAPKSATEALEELLTQTFRQSGAPYATQIVPYSP